MNHAILLISCPDQKGITASITNFIFNHNGNIVHADQHIDDQNNTFFMRLEWALDGFVIDKEKVAESFLPLAQKFDMQWTLHFTTDTPRVAIFVSRHLHCLFDVLYRYNAGHLPCEIAMIVSNHPDAAGVAKDFRIPFYHIPLTKENKIEQEQKEIELLQEHNIELIVLARYHQILTENFVNMFSNRIINIHHSFLPAFIGKSPYAQAYQKGVKIIGATSHYVTADLDEGPIIEQDTVRISHRDSLDDLIRKGEDLEKIVFSRAIRWHLNRRILNYGNKTVVFD